MCAGRLDDGDRAIEGDPGSRRSIDLRSMPNAARTGSLTPAAWIGKIRASCDCRPSGLKILALERCKTARPTRCVTGKSEMTLSAVTDILAARRQLINIGFDGIR
jgi:hypothetical protein